MIDLGDTSTAVSIGNGWVYHPAKFSLEECPLVNKKFLDEIQRVLAGIGFTVERQDDYEIVVNGVRYHYTDHPDGLTWLGNLYRPDSHGDFAIAEAIGKLCERLPDDIRTRHGKRDGVRRARIVRAMVKRLSMDLNVSVGEGHVLYIRHPDPEFLRSIMSLVRDKGLIS